MAYGVASVSRIDKIIGLFCKRALQKRRYSAKETYNLIDLPNQSHPIPRCRISQLAGVQSVTWSLRLNESLLWVSFHMHRSHLTYLAYLDVESHRAPAYQPSLGRIDLIRLFFGFIFICKVSYDISSVPGCRISQSA